MEKNIVEFKQILDCMCCSESNELCEMETSPSNLGEDCLSMDMMAD